MERRGQQALAQAKAPKREHVSVPYERISPDLVRAVVAGEDLFFFYHSGLDWEQIRVAFVQNWKEKRFARGASTITQQLGKNLFLSPSKNPFRKLHEALIAKEMELILDKRRILELYLNTIEWGDGIYGAEAAARHYFNTSADSLSLDQAVFLAAIIPDPHSHHDPSSEVGKDKERASRIRALMEHPLLVHFELKLRRDP
jgi:monofunctional biosynthetic peptidoglycan transglycosylase